MAIDTVGLWSPPLDQTTAHIIEQNCIRRQGLDLKTGELIYSITTGSLQGTYDSRISLRIEKEKAQPGTDGNLYMAPCEPFLAVEASVHKAMLGHNVYGGPVAFREACRWLIGLIETLIDVTLPPADEWEVRRVDVAEVYELPSFEACQEWFRGLNAGDYPRRSVDRYGLSGVYAKGSTTALKFYHKGPEFQKHDRRRLKYILDERELFILQEKANRIIRVEAEIKARKFKYDFGRLPLVGELSEQYLNSVHDLEVQRFMKEGAKEMQLVRGAHEVEQRLFEVYSPRLAGLLLGTWYKLAVNGEEYVKSTMPKRTFYRQRKQLIEAGISWIGTDVVLRKSTIVPPDFSPVRTDPRRISEEHPDVVKKLLQYKSA